MATSPGRCAVEPFAVRLWLYLRWSAALTVLFFCTYGATNWLAAQRSTRWQIFWREELRIPFVPWMIWVYLSVNAMLTLPLFANNVAGINRYGQACGAATLIAAVFHWALPAETAWPRPAAVPGFEVFAEFFRFDRPHNLIPSLHVTYSTLAVLAIPQGGLRWAAMVWASLLIASTMLVHQHHLIDVASGLALAAGCHAWLGRKE